MTAVDHAELNRHHDFAAHCLAVAGSYLDIAVAWLKLDPLRSETACRNAMIWNEKARDHVARAERRP